MTERKRKSLIKIGIYSCIFILCFVGAVFLGGEKEVDKEALKPLLGAWECQDTTLEERGNEESHYVGCYGLRVFDDGTFTLVDVEAGNPGIAGWMYPDGGGNMPLKCDEGDFDPPYLWMEMGMKTDSTLQYSFHENNGTEQLYLIFADRKDTVSTLVFDRAE